MRRRFFLLLGLGLFWPSVAFAQDSRVTAADMPDSGPMHSMAVIDYPDGGQALEFLGEISFDAMDMLRAQLDAHPEARFLYLTSSGGRVEAVDEIWPKLLERKLTTVVPWYCASACADLFLVGDRRLLAEGAVLGFHGVHPDLSQDISAEEIAAYEVEANASIKRRMMERGIPAAFADRVIATTPDALWYPSRDELLTAGLVTERDGTAKLSPSVLSFDPSAFLDWSVLNEPGMAAYRLAFLEDYLPLRWEAWRIIQAEGWGSERARRLVADHVMDSLPRSLAIASDEAAAAFVRSYAIGIAYTQQVDPRACTAIHDGDPDTGAELDVRNDARLHNLFIERVVELFRSLRERPHRTPPSRSEYREARETVLTEARRSGTYSDADANVLRDPQGHPMQFCANLLQWLNAVLQASQPQRSIVLRGMLLYASND